MQRIARLAIPVVLACACAVPSDLAGPDAGSAVERAAGHISVSTRFARVDLGTLGGLRSYATAISDRGVVVGWSEMADGTTRAFRWSEAEGMTELGTLPGHANSRAVAIVEGGLLGGGEILGVSGDAFDWTPVTWSALGAIEALPIPPLPGAPSGIVSSFTARGDVVGMDYVGFGHGWVWSARDGKYDLTANAPGGSHEGTANAIGPSGVVLLSTRAFTCTPPFSATCWRTYLWSARDGYHGLGTPDGGQDVDVLGLGLNEEGTVAGWRRDRSGTSAYRWSAAGGFTMLPHLEGSPFPHGYATAVNASRSAVGAEWLDGAFVAVAWPADGGVVRLSPNDPNAGLAVAINASGTIAGWAAGPQGSTHAVIWTPGREATDADASVNAMPRASVASGGARCLVDAQAFVSMQALFDCAADADRAGGR